MSKTHFRLILAGFFFFLGNPARGQADSFASSFSEAFRSPAEIRVLEIEEQDLSELPDSLAYLTSLETLRIRRCTGVDLEVLFDALPGPEKLRELDISWNQLEVLPSTISGFGNLRTLNLSENRFAVLPPALEKLTRLTRLNLKHSIYLDMNQALGVLSLLPQLHSLILSYCQMEELPEVIGDFQSLRSLDLEGNYLLTLPGSLSRLASLEKLTLRKNFRYEGIEAGKPLLETIEQEQLFELLGSMPGFDSLDISRCELAYLAGNVDQMKGLRFLSLEKNRLLELPAGIGRLAELRHLDMSNPGTGTRTNKLNALPASFNNLNKLEYLNLNGNDFVELNLRGPFPEMKTLLISWNRLKRFPEGIRYMKKLKTLRLNINLITEIPEWIDEPELLEELSINGDFFLNRNYKIQTLPTALTRLRHLKILNLNDHVIEALPAEMGGLRSLEHFEMKDNLLQKLPESMGNCKGLRWVDLKANELKSLPLSFNNLNKLEYLNLSFNTELSGLELIPALRGCENLKTLDITFTAPLNLEGLNKIRAALPGTMVVYARIKR